MLLSRLAKLALLNRQIYSLIIDKNEIAELTYIPDLFKKSGICLNTETDLINDWDIRIVEKERAGKHRPYRSLCRIVFSNWDDIQNAIFELY